MKENYTEEELIEIAKKRMRLKRNMYRRIITYIVVNTFFIIIYYLTNDGSSDVPWYIWPLTIWGIKLVLDIAHAIQDLRSTYNVNALDKEVEKIKRKINKGE